MTSSGISRQLIRKSLSKLTQGSTLTFRSKVPCSVVVQPEWRDDGIISFLENTVQLDVREEELLRTSLGRVTPHICVNVASSIVENTPSTPHLTIQVPEKINLNCNLLAKGSSVSIPGKIEGDVLIQADGVIQAKKLRGHSIDLQAHQIIVSDLLEAASLRVQTSGRFRAKQVHCSRANIQVLDGDSLTPEHTINTNDTDDEHSLIDISALFISTGNDSGGGASIKVHPRQSPTSHRAVRIKSNHGPVLVEVTGNHRPDKINEFTNIQYPLVELGGVNGQCEVSVLQSAATASNDEWVSCQIHVDSLSTGSVSLVTADCGDVAITVDRKVEADLRLLSHPSSETLLESSSLLAEEEDEEMICNVLKQLSGIETNDSRIHLQSPAFSKKSNSFSTDAMEYVGAVVENKSAEPDSRFDRQSGKVRIDGAGAQALSRFSGSEHADEKPLLAVVGVGNIVMETVSWFGAIARRYGLEESERKLGRTASRRGRAFAPTPPTRS